MATSRETLPFEESRVLRERLRSKAPSDPVCREQVVGCREQGGSFPHFCCGAHKILNPSLESPLSWSEFAAVLEHYSVHLPEGWAEEGYRDYLMDACMGDVSDQIDEADMKMVELYDSAVIAEESGNSELARTLFDKAHIWSQKSMQLVKKARTRASELAAAL